MQICAGHEAKRLNGEMRRPKVARRQSVPQGPCNVREARQPRLWVVSKWSLRLPIGIVVQCKPWASPVHRRAPMDFYTIIAPGSVAGCSCGHRQCDILGPAIVGAGAHSQLRQIDRVDEEVWDPVHCLPKIEKVQQPRLATRQLRRASCRDRVCKYL